MTITDKRPNFRPFEYPQFNEYHLAAIQSPWSHLEVSMARDIRDFEWASQEEKNIIGGILRGFTLAENWVGEYWSTIVRPCFPKPEIIGMAATFSHQEALHALAYNHLDSSLGLDSYEAILADSTALSKLNRIEKLLQVDLSPFSLARSLAVFSGGVEGVSLYASFAILLSFGRIGKFKGMSQILSWSVLDEALHSKAGIELYHILCRECPWIVSDKLHEDIREAISIIVNNEVSFIKNAFGNIDEIPGCIDLDSAIAFVYHRANKKLAELNLEPVYREDGAENVSSWFYLQTSSTVHNDFFAQSRNGGGYSAKLSYDYSDVGDLRVFYEDLVCQGSPE